MAQELQTLQTELTIERQKSEIMELKFRLQKTQAEKASRLDDSLFAPALYEHYQKVATTLAKSSVVPEDYRGKPEDVFVAMAMGYQLGFPVEQSLQDVAVINGRPCLWGDGLLSLCLNHPDCEGIDEQPIYNGQNIIGFTCTVKRKGHQEHTQTFTLQDAERAGLLKKGGVWNHYPTRMLQMRARSLALRDKFADALRGLRVADIEQEDSNVIDGEIIQEDKQTQTENLKNKLQGKNNDEQPENVSRETQKDYSTGDDNEPVSVEQLDRIEALMEIKNFDDNRRKKAMDYFKVDSLDKLSDAQARVFLLQLEKA